MKRRTPAEIRKEDNLWKPGGEQFNTDAIKLNALAENRGRQVTYDHLSVVKMGDPENTRPLCVGTIPRLTESLSVLYRVPATRMLKTSAGKVLSDKNAQSKTFAELSRRMMIDNVWQLVDMKRNLLRQCALVFVESHPLESVQARVFAPFDTFRVPTPGAADIADEDEHIAFQIRDGGKPQQRIYQLWQHEDDGSWRMWIVDEAGANYGAQPYGDEGVVPFDQLPILFVYDSLPAGAAYLPLPESRLDFALNINALVNDLAYLVKLEAHTMKVAITADTKSVKPTHVGPDKLTILPEGSDLKLLSHSPQFDGVNKTVDGQLSQLALGESLPADYFARDRKFHTGPALKASERDLESRRQRQVAIAVESERRAFKKYRSIHNVFAEDWGMGELDEDLTLIASFGRQWQPSDPKELQEVHLKNIAVCAGSVLGLIQDIYNVDRQAAIDLYEQFAQDAIDYPPPQNPAAMIDGPQPALGEDGAKKTPGAFNPEPATSTDGASIIDAAINASGPN